MARAHLFLVYISIVPIILLLISIIFKWRKPSFNDSMKKDTNLFLEFIQLPLVIYIISSGWNHELNVVWAICLCVELVLLLRFNTVKKWLLNLLFAIHQHCESKN